MPCLSDDELGLTLLRVTPGAEMRAVTNWLNRIKQHQSENFQAEVYLTLGRSDIAIVHAADLEVEADLCASSLPGVTCAKEIECYVWKGKTSVRDVLERPLCAMTFMRLNPDLWDDPHCLEVELEQRLAEHLSRFKPAGKAVMALLGTYGRDSSVVLIGSDEVEDLFRTNELLTHQGLPIAEQKRPILRETYTMVAVEWKNPEKGLDGLRGRYELSGTDGEYIANANVAVELRCCSADIKKVSDIALTLWRQNLQRVTHQGKGKTDPLSISVSYGPADVQFVFPLANYKHIGDLIVDIHKFRDLCKSVLLTTECRIELPIKSEDVSQDELICPDFKDKRSSLVHGIQIRTDEANRILKIHGEAPAILHSFYAYNHRLADDGGEAIRDMFLHYADCRELALKISDGLDKKSPIGEQLRELYKRLEEGQIGQIQRLDPFPMSRRAGTDLGPYRSGIRRKLWAAQAIPYYVLGELLVETNNHKRKGNGWRGFLIGGRLQDAFKTHAPVMNVPAETLPHPENWWVLTHESIHDFVERWRSLNLYDQKWTEAFVGFVGSKAANDKRRRRQFNTRIAVECVCDMLEYLSLGAIPWNTHQRVCWSYVLERLAADPGRNERDRCTIVAEHIVRTTCAMRCNPSLTQSSAGELLDAFIREVILYLQSEGVKVGAALDAYTKLVTEDQLTTRISAMQPAVEWILANNPFSAEHIEDRNEWRAKTFKTSKDALQQGKLVKPKTLKYPDLLVWLLKSDFLTKPMPTKMASATTLSLLWYYMDKNDLLAPITMQHNESQ